MLDPVSQDIAIQPSLSSDLMWLLDDPRTHDCWIAAEYRNCVIAISGSKLCMGHSRKRVVIIDLATRS